ncbi:MAG: helix-turn-helix transcriptional regulator [Polyangiaceae bacterium]|nr:helix-turn-helix transcriptional regulator [Polyangiaceae bacterium]
MTLQDERSLEPHPALRPLVHEVRTLVVMPGSRRVMTKLPNPTASLVLCLSRDGETKLLAVGPGTHASYKRVTAVPFYTRVALRPGAARGYFGVPLHELVDRVAPIRSLWGRRGETLEEELASLTGDPPAMLLALERELLHRLQHHDETAARRRLLGRAVAALDANPARGEPIAELARMLRVSERYLRQLFREEIGISPKHYARIARIRRVVSQMGAGRLARLATDHGFYDQAHLTSEFRDLLRVTPRAFLAGELPVH